MWHHIQSTLHPVEMFTLLKMGKCQCFEFTTCGCSTVYGISLNITKSRVLALVTVKELSYILEVHNFSGFRGSASVCRKLSSRNLCRKLGTRRSESGHETIYAWYGLHFNNVVLQDEPWHDVTRSQGPACEARASSPASHSHQARNGHG